MGTLVVGCDVALTVRGTSVVLLSSLFAKATSVALLVGWDEGTSDGALVGDSEGCSDGLNEGNCVGVVEGSSVGTTVG